MGDNELEGGLSEWVAVKDEWEVGDIDRKEIPCLTERLKIDELFRKVRWVGRGECEGFAEGEGSEDGAVGVWGVCGVQ